MYPSETYLSYSVSQTLVPLDPEEKCSRVEAFPSKNGNHPYSHGPCSSTSEDQLECVTVPQSQKKKKSLRTMCGGGRKCYSCRLYNDPLLGHGCGAHLTLGGGVLIETEPEASASERYLRCLLLPSVITCQLPFQTWQLTVETSKTKSQRFS